MSSKINSRPKLFVRNAKASDVDGISAVLEKVYSDMPPYPKDMIRGQINNFPMGHYVAELDGKIVGYSASIRISEAKALAKHTWFEITGGGYGTTHQENGEILYGYEVCVDPDKRRFKIGQRFYDERKKLCKYFRLKGIVFAGRVPNLSKKIKEVGTVENYVELVKSKKIRDSVLNFQLRNGFEYLGVFENYLPYDKQSMGFAVHLIWRNPEFRQEEMKNKKASVYRNYASNVRVATVQYGQRRISSFDEFKKIVTYYIDVVSDYKSDFVLFPELFTLQLLSIDNEPLKPHIAIEKMSEYTEDLKAFFYEMALKYNVNIIAGSHPTKKEDGKIYNVSYIFLRDGSIYEQPKIHPTPSESYWWNVQGGDRVEAIETDCGPIGVLICYDSEFPELSRHLVNQGINILFVPFLTDERQGYCRVRYCAQARAVENQIYVVMSGSVGNLPNVQNIDIHYSQSCILTPCDFQFSRDGIAADTTPNVETVSFADLRIDNLIDARNSGTVQNLKNRRHDLYSVKWHGR